MTGPVTGSAPGPAASGRIAGLDGLRGVAALFVVLHHCLLTAYAGFPQTSGPAGLAVLRYGHFAVVLFIALSGFSLAASPARRGWRLGGIGRFAQRRAWRILPPYWAALTFALAVAWLVVPQPGEGAPNAASVVVYGLLIQDVADAPSPNGAFWSIAIEAQLYAVFPLLLLLVRRWGTAAMLASATAVVGAIGLLAPHSGQVARLMHLGPQFAVLFAAGAVAAGILTAPRTGKAAKALPWLAAAAVLPVCAVIAARGTPWTVAHFFWVDLALAPAAGLLLAALAAGRPGPLVRLLDSRPLRSLGSYSYSLYLMHAPIVVAVGAQVVNPILPEGLARFAVLLLVAVPVSLAVSRLFAAAFEAPFVRHRSWTALRAAAAARVRAALGRGTSAPHGPAEPAEAAGEGPALPA
ncbi:peptidoglycan/LPS O-acetylase OafA/YrhL [Actinocorallia herbida]|uniref:Peptidoglycan/LPS O-acetylase OafA/YrhL n=1 Tax=Actinocorallia herbida TaxID=58109 RepID=A0A3N1CN51_9ACTN|nr:acyltransferase [Actinocorallia herbida]ROO82737.1 peptidoglycan/LPS O-acetylase OafA/YrhL [Actinocorallia herbida]